MRLGRAYAAAAALGALAVILSGCSAGAASTGVPAGAARFYAQHLHWTSCHDGLLCAQVAVPEDWSKPGGTAIHVGLIEQKAGTHAKGTLVFNPGGPGQAAETFASKGRLPLVTAAVSKVYNIVGYDPPGVGSSTPVSCMSNDELGRFLFAPYAGTVGSAGWAAAYEKRQATFAAQCIAKSGAGLLAHVDTVTAARDLDVVRAALGESRLNYLGDSYGTDLGIVYESLFPQRIGRMVLDGVDDPNRSPLEFDLGQAQGFERDLDDYLKGCLLRSCLLHGTLPEARQQLQTLLERFAARPADSGEPGYRVDQFTAGTGLIEALYSTSFTADLDQAITEASAGDGSQLFQLAEQYYGWSKTGADVSPIVAYYAVICADHTELTAPADMAAEATKLTAAAPFVGPYLGYQGAICAGWPATPAHFQNSTPPKPANTVLLVSATEDPATPYSAAVAVEKRLGNARLLTRAGDGHTSYNGANGENDCIDAAVDAYLIHGTLPASGTRC